MQKSKLTHEVCLTQLSPTLDDFFPDAGLIVGHQPVFKAGRLVEFIPKWREITSDPNILQYVQGVKMSIIEGIESHQQAYRPTVFKGQQHEIVQNEIQSLLLQWVLRNHTLREGSLCRQYFYAPGMMGLFI